MKTEFDNSAGEINIIPQDIGRVLFNFLNNANYALAERKKLEHNGYAPDITVRTKRSGNKIEIFVKDNGTGIPRENKGKIFKPFFTTKPPK
jgi:signal transduction histidine kinase